MTPELTDLMMRYETAADCLKLLEMSDVTGAVFDAQVKRCRALRAQMNALCPDGEHDPHEGNVVERIA